MSLKSDDFDLEENYLYTLFGGNGDYYICIGNKDENGYITTQGVRIAMSGGQAPHEVKMAAFKLFEAMEKHGLNEMDFD